MSLETEPAKPTTKKALAEQLALKYKDLPLGERRTKIREEVPCSKSCAQKAIAAIEKQQAAEKAVKPSFEVVSEEGKQPEFLPATEEKPLEELKEKPLEEVTPADVQEQLDIFRDMLRGIHNLTLSKEGILGTRYGRDPKQCEMCSDQLYRWLVRRYGTEALARYDTLLLILSYGTLVGGIAKDFIAERQKKAEKTEKQEEKAA